jgi:hypothetical protein
MKRVKKQKCKNSKKKTFVLVFFNIYYFTKEYFSAHQKAQTIASAFQNPWENFNKDMLQYQPDGILYPTFLYCTKTLSPYIFLFYIQIPREFFCIISSCFILR